MSKPSLILIGAGGHTRACIDIIERQDHFQIEGLVGMPNELNTLQFGYKVIATDKELPELARVYQYAFITVGQIKTPEHRIRLFQMAIQLGFQLPVIVSSNAYVSTRATIGAGTMVMNGSIINAGARVGCNCIINTRAVVEHEVLVADHCHISTGVMLNGGVDIGKGSFIGSGSVVKEGVSIGQGSVVGMGISVRHDLADYTRFVGEKK